MNPETLIQRRIQKHLKAKGRIVIRLDPVNGTGMPDLLTIEPGGRAHFIEVKTARGRLSAVQRAMIQALRDAGALVTIARKIEDLKES